MTSYSLMLAPAVLASIVLLALLYRRIYVVGDRTADQVLPAISPLGPMGVHELFSPVAERHLRARLSPQEFRRAQRYRMVLAIEYVRRISHNAWVLQQWAIYEMRQARAAGRQEPRQLSADLIASSVKCRICSMILLSRLNCLRFRTALIRTGGPSFDGLIRFGTTDIVALYISMRVAASLLSRRCGEGKPSLAQLL